MRTLRSRGIDMSAIAFFDASSRIRIIVSERAPALASRACFARLSEPTRSSVWGLPGSAWARRSRTGRSPWIALAMRSTWWMPAITVVAPQATITTSAPSRERFQIPRRSGSSGNAKVAGAQPHRDRVHELDERAAVALERRDRHPLLGAVVTAADRPELDAGRARLEEADDVGRAVAPDRDPLRRHAVGHALREQSHVRVVALDDRRVAAEDDVCRGVRDRLDVREDRGGGLARQEADVDVDRAAVGHLVHGVAADDPAEAHRGPVEQLARLARERHRLDRAEHVDRL